uniref:NADH-ubiquinone oxidoreductase chain 3 n=2 Tax=Lygus TaxID=30084 RepID=A0A0F6MY30_9HEMI|nr:NADH dehydrogenase subunit 3 [Lygus pratensis]AHN95679.1 NADH dehydrogenase subunit 3 [Lygus rugulipennis]AWI69712.1 NADH dehydrogenase subunit 3 [Lygus pratensis]
MLKITMSIMMTIILSIIMMTLCMLISKKSMMDREKMSPFECGFDPKSSSRVPFSSQFFLVAVLFLIFDIEIVIILPMIITIKTSNMMYWFMTSTMFLVILIIGLYHEWKNGILEWAN